MCEAPSRTRYSHGCRCDECRVAQRNYQRAYYQKVGGNKNRKPEVTRAYYEKQKEAGAYAWTPKRKASADLRRARKYSAEAERFDRQEVFERDQWICGLCGLSVDPSLKYPHPASPSLDHIQPLSLGGNHTRANTRLAHVRCNVVRGNRI